MVTPTHITDVLGRSRAVARVWPGGEWECPFCFSSTDPAKDCGGRREGYSADCPGGQRVHCQNPACFANPHYPADRARADLEKAQREADEEARRKRDREWARENAEEGRLARQAQIDEIRGEARARGVCVRCAMEGAPHRTKFVKHRAMCPKEKRV